jgi:hypothetical protein
MAKRKYTSMVTPNTLETTIEYTLISSILDRICEMIKTPLEYLRDPPLLDLVSHTDTTGCDNLNF